MNIALIILAAGNSSRLGQPKQLLRRGNQSMIQYIYGECVNSQLGPTYVVTGAYHDAISNELENAIIIHNDNWIEGMATSISYAIQTIKQESLDGAIIVLSDQIFLTADILKRLAYKASTDTSKIVNCQYQQGMGPPTYFDKSLFSELMQLSGDAGAQSIVRKYASSTSSIEFQDGNLDLDTTDDLKILDRL